jgi:hypothetical protein
VSRRRKEAKAATTHWDARIGADRQPGQSTTSGPGGRRLPRIGLFYEPSERRDENESAGWATRGDSRVGVEDASAIRGKTFFSLTLSSSASSPRRPSFDRSRSRPPSPVHTACESRPPFLSPVRERSLRRQAQARAGRLDRARLPPRGRGRACDLRADGRGGTLGRHAALVSAPSVAPVGGSPGRRRASTTSGGRR